MAQADDSLQSASQGQAVCAGQACLWHLAAGGSLDSLHACCLVLQWLQDNQNQLQRLGGGGLLLLRPAALTATLELGLALCGLPNASQHAPSPVCQQAVVHLCQYRGCSTQNCSSLLPLIVCALSMARALDARHASRRCFARPAVRRCSIREVAVWLLLPAAASGSSAASGKS